MGESPPAGWEGGSELAFPLDDVPKDASAKPSRQGEFLVMGFSARAWTQRTCLSEPRLIIGVCKLFEADDSLHIFELWFMSLTDWS